MTSPYKKITICYFSGTGNARNTAMWIADEAEKAGIDAEVVDIAKTQRRGIDSPISNTLIGFIGPTHGFHFPKIMRRFIRHFPKAENCSALVMNTRGGLKFGNTYIGGVSGVLHFWSSLILKRKGYKITGLYTVDLPSNWISLHPALGKEKIILIYQHIEPKVRNFASTIISGGKNFKALSIRNLLFDILISPISLLYILFGQYFFSKSYIASSACDNCGLCEKQCPVQAIKTINGRKFWTTKCENCMQCMNICPKQAIETAHGFIISTCIIASVIINIIVFELLKHPTFENWLWMQNENIMFWVKSVFMLASILINYLITHWLMQFKFFERLVVHSSLTSYKFWGRYKAPKNK